MQKDESKEYLESIREQWVEPFGDMKNQELFLLVNLDKIKMIEEDSIVAQNAIN